MSITSQHDFNESTDLKCMLIYVYLLQDRIVIINTVLAVPSYVMALLT